MVEIHTHRQRKSSSKLEMASCVCWGVSRLIKYSNRIQTSGAIDLINEPHQQQSLEENFFNFSNHFDLVVVAGGRTSVAQRHRVSLYAQFCCPDDNDPTYSGRFLLFKKNKINEKSIKKMTTISQVARVFRVPSSIVVINCETGQSPFSRPVYTHIYITPYELNSRLPLVVCVYRFPAQSTNEMNLYETNSERLMRFLPPKQHESQYLFFLYK
jgi:hypothetical protein